MGSYKIMASKSSNSGLFTTISMIKTSGFITLVSVISKILGFVRETVIAAVFGATGITDSYLVAYMLPS